MTSDELRKRFPRSHTYSLDWIREGGMGSHPLWLAEWLSQSLDLRPGLRVLDLGCGKAKSSIFLAREFGVEVWATDLWVSPSENSERIRDAGLLTPTSSGGRVIPLRSDAHKLPFAAEYFDVITAHDCYSYFGTDDLYLNYLAQFVRPGGQIGIAGAGLAQELPVPVPEHLRPIWSHDFFCLHSAGWWRHHWARTGIVAVELADSMPNATDIWTHWQRTNSPDNVAEIQVVEEDAGRYLTYIRMVGRRNEGVEFQPYCWPDGSFSLPHTYESTPLVQPGV
ncbi:MAG: cyclopropane-fatty-acyl-phospholipid synthase family protein [Pirellulales bacterium]